MRRHLWWLGAVVLVALNLRTPIASIPPVAGPIGRDLHLSAAAMGLLTTLPVVCMGLFAPVGALASRRWGRGRVLAGAVALILAGTAMRLAPGLLWTATVVSGVGIAVAGALLPALVRARFPERVGPVTGLYTAGLIGGAMLAAALTEPARQALGGSWPAALAVWALPAALALAVWIPVAGGSQPVVAAEPRARAPWGDRTAWYAALFMGGQSLMYYGILAWLAPRYTAIGVPAAEAGLLLGLFSATQLVSALALPALAHRLGRLRVLIAASVATSAAMLTLIALVPSGAPYLWTALLGLGVGGQFALALTVLGSLGGGPAGSAAISGMAFFVGYLLAAVGPVAAGWLRDITGEYRVPFLALAAVGTATLVAGVATGRAVTTPGRSDVPA